MKKENMKTAAGIHEKMKKVETAAGVFGFGSLVLDLCFWIFGLRSLILDLWFGIFGFDFRVQISGFSFQISDLRFQI